jgi:hypothetical protein
MNRKPIYKLIVLGVILILIILMQINFTKKDVYVRNNGVLTRAKIIHIDNKSSGVDVSIDNKEYYAGTTCSGKVGDSITVYHLSGYSNVIPEDEGFSFFQFIFIIWYILIAIGGALIIWGIVGEKVKIKQLQIKTTKRERRRRKTQPNL